MRPRKVFTVLLAIATLITVAAAAPATASHGANGKICMVYDIGDPNSGFNASAAEGAREAAAKLHVEVAEGESATVADIAANIDAFVAAGDCDLIIGVAFIVAAVMEPFIADNPGQNFAVLDFSFWVAHPNVAEIDFEVNEAGFLAGYLAAGVTETGKVGVFGGQPIMPVTLFMDGYALGVEWYNSVYGTSVEVLGWNPHTQTGLFSFTFQDPGAGQALADHLYDEGADIVFPVAGRTGFGVVDEANERKTAGEDVFMIGVDIDYYELFVDSERVILTSVLKDLGPAVFNQAAAIVDGTWMGGEVLEGLEEGFTDIAPLHKTNQYVPGFLKNDLKALRSGIIDGTIPTLP